MGNAVRASIMITCLGEVFMPEVGMAMVTVLRRLGVTVDVPADQTCCGMPLYNSGYHRDAARVAARTVGLFAGAEHVVVPSGSCAWMVKTEYPRLLAHDQRLKVAAESLAARTREMSQFLVGVLGVTDVGARFSGSITYHDSCHLLRGLGESRSPRTLLSHVAGAELVELPGSDQCCGFGGSFAVRMPQVSTAIVDKKVAAVESTGADCLAACDAGCLMQIGGCLSRRRSRVRPLHLAQILAGEAGR
jgi:L-lactate dehydrogenase complex protein LldE